MTWSPPFPPPWWSQERAGLPLTCGPSHLSRWGLEPAEGRWEHYKRLRPGNRTPEGGRGVPVSPLNLALKHSFTYQHLVGHCGPFPLLLWQRTYLLLCDREHTSPITPCRAALSLQNSPCLLPKDIPHKWFRNSTSTAYRQIYIFIV